MLGRLGSRSYISVFSNPKEKVDAAHRARVLNYTDRDIGIRNPDYPGGFLASNSGVVEMYSGSAHLYATLSSDILASSSRFAVMATSIFLSPSNIDNLYISGKTISNEIFNGKKKYMVIKNASSFAGAFVLTPISRVQPDGSISPVLPLSAVLEEHSLFVEKEVSSLESQTLSIIKKALF